MMVLGFISLALVLWFFTYFLVKQLILVASFDLHHIFIDIL